MFKYKVKDIVYVFDDEKLYKGIIISRKKETNSSSAWLTFYYYLVKLENGFVGWLIEDMIHPYIDTTDVFVDIENLSIIDIFQRVVNKIAEQEYKDDECPPKFTVSLYEKEGTHEIILTIEHLGEKKSRKLFPRPDCKYGYESIKDEMRWLYNSTM